MRLFIPVESVCGFLTLPSPSQLCTSNKQLRFDVRLTHNHVTISVSILCPIILLLLNYIAQPKKKTFCTKKLIQTFFHIRAIIYICRRSIQLFSFSYSTLSNNVSRVCWFVGCVKYSRARDVLMKNQLLSDWMLCFFRFFLLLQTHKTWRIFQNFFFCMHARSDGRRWRKQFLSRRSRINLSGWCRNVFEKFLVCMCRSHSSHFDLDVSTTYHTFLFSRCPTRSSRMFIYHFFFSPRWLWNRQKRFRH